MMIVMIVMMIVMIVMTMMMMMIILQVMMSEIKRTLSLSDEEAADKLLNLPPFETKNLLHHIMSGQEYEMDHLGSRLCIRYIIVIIMIVTRLLIRPQSNNISRSEHSRRLNNENDRKMSVFQMSDDPRGSNTLEDGGEDAEDDMHRTGMWVRRRLLDGSLNR